MCVDGDSRAPAPRTGVCSVVSRHRVDLRSSPSRSTKYVLLVAVAAVVMGLPTVRGVFVGSDDNRLVLNHVLVSRPSVAHAVELFTIPHRDLYQPLPLLSFSVEFALLRALRLDERGGDGVAWLFHVDNILLHAINAVLVWLVVLRLHGLVASYRQSDSQGAARVDETSNGNARAPAVATVAALLYAAHPLQTEVVAWINGRMMLLSTLFALLTVLSFWRCTAASVDAERRTSEHRVGWGIASVVWTLFCAISKVRVGLPIIVLLPAFLARTLLRRRTIVVWAGILFVTGVFAWINIRTTADAEMFSGGAESLHGPRLVRVLLALANYFSHVVWPVGLASYYPTPPVVHWADAGTIRAALIVAPALALWLWFARRSLAARLGLVWFFATLASTLPFVPARNVLAADRYMYLPIIGLFWPLAQELVRVTAQWAGTAASRRRIVFGGGGLVVASCIGMSWHVGSFYATAQAKTRRIAETAPDVPRGWTHAASSLYELGDYAGALEYAARDLAFDDVAVQSAAMEVIGACKIKLGRTEEGLLDLRRAVELDDQNGHAKYRLATAYEDLGRTEEAVRSYESAIEASPRYNPPLIRLASLYRAGGRYDEARHLYLKALETNAYEVPAIIGLAELEIHAGDRASLRDAQRRLRALLEDVPEHMAAWIDLGVVSQKLGDTDVAVSIYQSVLLREPDNATAALNLAQILQSRGQTDQARSLLAQARRVGVTTLAEAIGMFDAFVRQGEMDRAADVWSDLLLRLPDSDEVRAWAAWSLAVAERSDRALAMADRVISTPATAPLLMATRALAMLQKKDHAEAAAALRRLVGNRDTPGDAERRLLLALERHDLDHDGDPWTICLAARLLIADGQLDAGRAFTDLCADRCAGGGCDEWVGTLLEALGRGY